MYVLGRWVLLNCWAEGHWGDIARIYNVTQVVCVWGGGGGGGGGGMYSD